MGLTRDDPLAGAPVFHDSFVESGKGTGGLWFWPLWVSRAFVLVLGDLNSKKATPTVEVLNGLEKRDCHVPVGKASFASRETPWNVWVLSFPSVDLKVASRVIVWQLVGLSRSVRGS